MMTLNEFLASNIGQSVETSDPSNPYQCMDLAYVWCDALGVPRDTIRQLNAFEVWTKPHDSTLQYFDYIPNTPNGLPKEGDLVVFNQGVGPSGHISIATAKADVNTFTSVDQNWNGVQSVQLVDHNYTNVSGWLRKILPQGNEVLVSLATKLNVSADQTGVLARIETLLAAERTLVEKDQEIQTLRRQLQNSESLRAISLKLNVPEDQTTVLARLDPLLAAERAVIEKEQVIQSLTSQLAAIRGTVQEFPSSEVSPTLTYFGVSNIMKTTAFIKNLWNFLKGKNMIIAGLLLIFIGVIQDDPQRIMEGLGLIGLRLMLFTSKKLRLNSSKGNQGTYNYKAYCLILLLPVYLLTYA